MCILAPVFSAQYQPKGFSNYLQTLGLNESKQFVLVNVNYTKKLSQSGIQSRTKVFHVFIDLLQCSSAMANTLHNNASSCNSCARKLLLPLSYS